MPLSPEQLNLLQQARESDARKKEEEQQRKAKQVERLRNQPEPLPAKIKRVAPNVNTEQPYGDLLEDVMSAVGVAEVAASFGTGAFASFVGLLEGGYLEMEDALRNERMREHGDIFKEKVEEWTDAMMYTPRSEEGQTYMESIGKYMPDLGNWADMAGDWIFEQTGSSSAASATEVGVFGVPFFVPVIAGKGAFKKGAKGDKEKLTRRKEVKDDKFDTSEQNEILNKLDTGEDIIDLITPDEAAIAARSAAKKSRKRKETEGKVIDKNQLDLDLEDTTKVVVVEAPKPLVSSEVTKRAAGVEKTQQKAIDHGKYWEMPDVKEKLIKLNEKVFDASSGVRHRIKAGKDKLINRQVESWWNRVLGAVPKAQLHYQQAEMRVYGGLSTGGVTKLDKLINSLRTIQIDANAKKTSTKPPAHPDGRTGRDHLAAVQEMKRKLGDKEFNNLFGRAKQYFNEMGDTLKGLYQEGLITRKQYDAMKRDIYEPRKFIERMDPVSELFIASDLKGKHIKQTDSGLQQLNRGDIGMLEMNSRALLQEYIVRSTGRVWQNQANKKLLDWTKANPKNGWVRVGKEGEKVGNRGSIDVWLDGKKTRMIMDKEMALQWVRNTYVLNHTFANMLRGASLQWIMKPMTTAANPEFALKLFALDIVHAHFATNVFNKSLPVYLTQMSRELATVAKDAFGKGGRYKDAINEGLGMNFLTHQGTDVFGKAGALRSTTKWRQAKAVASWLNEGFELWVRLAIRERALRNMKKKGLDPDLPENRIEATAKAREYIDFSQGGSYTKAFDAGIPYLNSISQAFRTIGRSAKERPGRFAFQIGELAILSGAWALYQELYHSEVMEQLSVEDKAKNWHIPTGRSIRDPNGNVRHLVFKIRKDNAIAGFVAPFEMAVRAIVSGEMPEKPVLDWLKSTLPVIPTDIATPTGAALGQYYTNTDFWQNPIWSDPDLDVGVSPVDEAFGPSLKRERTSPFWTDVARTLSSPDDPDRQLSPARLQKAAQNIVPDNTYVNGLNWLYNEVTGQSDDPFLMQNVTEQELARQPFIRQFLHVTHPMGEIEESARYATKESQVSRLKERQGLERLIAEDVSDKNIQTWIKAQDPTSQERLFMRYHTFKEVRKLFDTETIDVNVPSWAFWNNVAINIKDPEMKAWQLYWEYADMPTAKARNDFMRVANRLSVDKQIWSGDTMKHFRRLQQYWNTQLPTDPEDRDRFVDVHKKGQAKDLGE